MVSSSSHPPTLSPGNLPGDLPKDGSEDCSADAWKDAQENSTLQVDVAIVGGGIVGLTLAAALRTSGMTVAIIEAQTPQQVASRQRAYAFSLTSGEIFKELGLWPDICDRITHFQRVCLSDADHAQRVEFCPQDSGMEAVYYAAEHPVLMAALQRCIEQAPNLHYLSSATLQSVDLTAHPVSLRVQMSERLLTIAATLVVAADGAKSHLRQQAKIPTFGWKYWQSCITTVLAPEQSHAATAYERFWPSGPFAILPLPGNRCQIVWTAPHAEAQAMMALPPEQFMAELQRRYGSQMGRLTLLSQPLMFPVQLMQSRHYVRPRLALVGDAAHCCHPVGGQGLNMGIRDAAALAEVLLTSYHRGEDLGALSVLQRYERWRRRENWVILSFTDFLTRFFSNQIWPLVQLRRLGIRVIQAVPPLKRLLLKLMTGRLGRIPSMSSSRRSC